MQSIFSWCILVVMISIEDKKKIAHALTITDSWICGYPSYYSQVDENCFFSETEKPQEESKESEHAGLTIAALNEKIAQCTRCPLSKTRNHTVSGEGCLKPLVLVIGEAPGADEDKSGRAFIGKAGQLLDKMLIAIDLSRESNTYIANIVKCRPPQNRDPLPEEQDACRSFLDLQIQLLKPSMILCLGRVSSQNMLGTKEAIGSLRGKFFEYKGIPLMPTYHPSALLRNESLKRPAWEDLKTFKKRLTEILGSEGI